MAIVPLCRQERVALVPHVAFDAAFADFLRIDGKRART
jgi:hypothetical protein